MIRRGQGKVTLEIWASFEIYKFNVNNPTKTLGVNVGA